jgi:MscS family membrane protein
VAKVFIVAFSLVFVAQNMGLNITSLLAGLGLGGLAFALAAKDTVENLFGSLTVLLDRPFRVGDWVALPGTNIEGIVDNVGLRSTRIRTFYDSLITVPNATLIRSSVDNYGERRFRRWFTRLGVQYDTPPEKIDAFCEAIRELIRLHPLTRKEAYHVYANEFGDSSLNILLVVFFNVPDWGTELRERHRLFVDIVRIAKELGVQFAFPTRTLHLVQGQNPVYTAIPNDTEQSMAQGRNAARDVLRRTFGEEIPAPPPLRYPAPVSLIPPNDPGAPQR